MSKLIYVLFLIHLVVLVCLSVFYFSGFPLRSFLIFLIGFLILFHEKEIIEEIAPVNWIYITLMGYGLLISVINNVPLPDIIDGELKLIQSYLVVFSSYYICRVLGFKYLGVAFILIAAVSATLGILQSLDFNFAWRLHDTLASWQNVGELAEFAAERPSGIAWYAIPQAYLLLSAIIFSCYFVLNPTTNTQQQLIVLGVNILLLLGILASETRSALGAAIIILAFIYTYRYRAQSFIFGFFAACTLLWLLLGENSVNIDSRLVSLDDQSSLDKLTLYKYGLGLFFQNPFGYGFGFDSVEYAHKYFINQFNVFSYAPEEKAQYIVPVHSAILKVAHTFGFIGLVLLGYYLFFLVGLTWYRCVLIAGAMLNAMFHTSGILANDLFIDMVIAAFLYESWVKDKVSNTHETLTPRQGESLRLSH